MPVPTLVTDLSTTLASNSPAGSDNVFPSLDDYLRALSGFVASIRDNSGNGWVSPYLPLTYAAGTANGVLYLNGSKVVTTGSGLTFDGTNFATTGTASATKLIPTGGSATGNGMYLPAANTLAWSNNGAETMRLDSSGNLGIGTTPSAWGASQKSLEISSLVGVVANPASDTLSAYAHNAYYNGTNWIYRNTSVSAARYEMTGANAGSTHAWYVSAGGTAGNAISFTQAMTLDASGRLGVGTTSPDAAYRMSLTGDGSTMVGGLALTSGGNVAYIGQVGATSADCEYWNAANGYVRFGTNATERARITSGGDLLVGTTSGTGYKLRVYEGGANLNASIFTNQTATYATQEIWNQATSGDNVFSKFYTEGSATARGSIDYNRAGGLVRYNTTSDYRAKDIIGPITNPGATIDALKVYEGKMKGATQSRPMLIAHEAQAHAPYAVSGVKDEVNEDGTPKFQQMDVSSLVPLLLAEIQSLRARVQALEAQP